MSRQVPDWHAAYVLHARPYRESSLLLDLLVLERGRVAAVARSVRGARASGRRALLQPLQPLHVGLGGRGDLATLLRFEAASPALPLRGDALLAALYVNELCLRLLPRDEPVDGFFLCYAECLATLAGCAGQPISAASPLSLALRRIESALLGVAGYGLDIGLDAQGRSLQADSRYWPDESGELVRVDIQARPSVSGAALQALAGGEAFLPAGEAAALRRLLRSRLALALGPRPLRCWGLLDELSGLQRERPDQGEAP